LGSIYCKLIIGVKNLWLSEIWESVIIVNTTTKELIT